MNEQNKLTLTSGGYEYSGWKSVSVTRSIEQAASSFSVSLSAEDDLPIRPGDECVIDIGRSRVLTGFVDVYSPSHGPTDHEITISGRSKTADIVDCSIVTEPLQFRNRTLHDIATVLAAPYGVTVLNEADLDAVIPRFVAEVGETPFAAIERLARDQSVLVTDNEHGELLLTTAGETEDPGLEHPGNIIAARLVADASQRYTHYTVKGQSVGNDENYGAAVAGIEALIQDDDVKRYRALVIKGDRAMSAADAKRRATWEAVTRAGRSAQVEATVQGWRAPDGLLWWPNSRIPVKDPVIGVDATMLVVSVTFTYDASGQRTSMLLAPPGAYLPEPPLEQKTKGKAKKKVTSGIAAWEELRGGV